MMTTRKAALWFWTVSLGVTTLWVVLPALLHSGYKLDTVELQFIAKEWTFSTKKHPMLPAWLLEMVNMLTNRAFVAPFIIAQLCVGVTLWSIWQLGKNVLSERLALLGVLSMVPYWFFTVESIKYNQNSVLVPLWALALLFVCRACEENRWRYWGGTGLAIGVGLYAKYSMVFLVVAVGCFMVFFARPRRLWSSGGPYLAALVALVVFIPHLVWLFWHGFPTLGYAESRRVVVTGWIDAVVPVEFVVSEVAYLLAPVVILLPVLGWRWRRRCDVSATVVDVRRLIGCVALIPFGLHILMYSIFRIELNTDYGAPFWLFVGVWLLLVFQSGENGVRFVKSVRLLVLLEGVMVVCLIFQAVLAPYVMGKISRTHYPMRELGTLCDSVWDARFDVPCLYVTGEWWTAGNAAISMRDRPSVLFYDDRMGLVGMWATERDLLMSGGMVVWEVDGGEGLEVGVEMPVFFAKLFPDAEVCSKVFELPYKTGAKITPVKVAIAVVRPQLVVP